MRAKAITNGLNSECTLKRQEVDREIKEHIGAIHKRRPYFGYLRMTDALREEGYHINHKRVYRLMTELGIQSSIRKKRRFWGRQPSVVHSNRLARDFKTDRPNQKWVTDITYLPINGRFLYLSSVHHGTNSQLLEGQKEPLNGAILFWFAYY